MKKMITMSAWLAAACLAGAVEVGDDVLTSGCLDGCEVSAFGRNLLAGATYVEDAYLKMQAKWIKQQIKINGIVAELADGREVTLVWPLERCDATDKEARKAFRYDTPFYAVPYDSSGNKIEKYDGYVTNSPVYFIKGAEAQFTEVSRRAIRYSKKPMNFVFAHRWSNGEITLSHSIGRHTRDERHVFIHSPDNGRTWNLNPKVAKVGCGNAFETRDGRRRWICCWDMDGKVATNEHFISVNTLEKDGTKTERQVLFKTPWPSMCGIHRDVQRLSDGRLVAEAWGHTYNKKGNEAGGYAINYFLESKDDGESWQYLSQYPYEEGHAEGLFESTLVERRDGSLLAICRTGYSLDGSTRHPLLQFVSHDGGRTWGERREISDNGVSPQATILADGTLVVLTGRPALFMLVDRTGTGERYEKLFVTKARTSAYASLVELEPGRIAVFFDESAFIHAPGDTSDNRIMMVEYEYALNPSFASDSKKEIELLPDEHWYGAETVLGTFEPFSATNLFKKVDMRVNHGAGIGGNQAAPLLLSNKGRWVWSERPFVFRFADGRLFVEADRQDAKVESGKSGDTLRSAYLHCSKTFFPPQGTPRLEWFRNPIINTWASLGYMQRQEDILELARGFKAVGVPPGVFMIDHGWHELSMGTWDFNLGFIPDPKGLVRELKDKLGYSAVTLWFDNHVAMESLRYRELCRKGYMLKSSARGYQLSFVSGWWAGWGAVLDCTNPECFEYTKNHLRWLMDTYGVDGFFFDAGDPGNFICNVSGLDGNVALPHDPNAAPSDQCRAYHMLGTTVPYQQHRASWKMGGLPLKQTERDKAPTFEALKMCLSNGIVAGLIGYPFIDFDMVGGGLYGPTQKDSVKVNQQQFVRSMQVQCLSPMVQLSIPPWKVLDDTHLAAFRKAIAIRQEWAPYIVETAISTGKTGEPMMRSLEYSFPGHGYETIMDEFLMGDRLLVAPQVVENAASRTVVIPPGSWKGDDGKIVTGPCRIETPTPLDRLPRWTKVESSAR